MGCRYRRYMSPTELSDTLAFILYSHSSLEWVLPAFVGQQQECFPILCPKYLFYDRYLDIAEYDCKVYLEEDKYSKRLLTCLEQVEEDFVIIHHEDMIFFDDVDMDHFRYYLEIMRTSDISYLKLLKGGLSQQPAQEYMKGVQKLQDDEPYRYAVQPAIWRKTDLLKILKQFDNNSIYELEVGGVAQFMVDNGYKCLFAFNEGDKKRGMYHWDNSKYPFIATALNKGEWNMVEYDIEIENIKSEYNLK